MISKDMGAILKLAIGKRAPGVYSFAEEMISLAEDYVANRGKQIKAIDTIDLNVDGAVSDTLNPISYDDARTALIIASNQMNLYDFPLRLDTERTNKLFKRYMKAYNSIQDLDKLSSKS